MVTISVGFDKTKFAVHKDALRSITNNLFCLLQSFEADPANPDQANLPD